MKTALTAKGHVRCALAAGLCVVAVLAVTGCAHLPDAKVTYYLAQSDVAFKVIRTVACDEDNHLVIASAITPTVTHSAERTAASNKIEILLANLKGTFSDSDVKFEFYEDGRLRAFNASSTGQGEAILKTAVTLASAALTVQGGVPQTFKTECAEIKTIAGDKPLTLTFEGEVKVTDAHLGQKQTLPPDTITAVYLKAHKLGALGSVWAVFKKKNSSTPPTAYSPSADEALLKAREPGSAEIDVMAGDEKTSRGDSIWTSTLAVAQFGTDYELPIPTPVVFGKEALGVSFAESGALTSVQFINSTGAGQALNVLDSARTATDGFTTAEKAAAVKAEADLIAQQQRLVQCLADPKNCNP